MRRVGQARLTVFRIIMAEQHACWINNNNTCAFALQPSLLHRFGGFACARLEVAYIIVSQIQGDESWKPCVATRRCTPKPRNAWRFAGIRTCTLRNSGRGYYHYTIGGGPEPEHSASVDPATPTITSPHNHIHFAQGARGCPSRQVLSRELRRILSWPGFVHILERPVFNSVALMFVLVTVHEGLNDGSIFRRDTVPDGTNAGPPMREGLYRMFVGARRMSTVISMPENGLYARRQINR